MALHDTQVFKTLASHPFSISGYLDSALAKLGNSLSSVSWTSACQMARENVFSTLIQISNGSLTIFDADGEAYSFGTLDISSETLQTTLHIRSNTFWIRVALFTDLGFAESFMDGEVDCDDITSFVKIFIANREEFGSLGFFAQWCLDFGRRLTKIKFLGELSRSTANISAHYDIGNVLFKTFLSDDMNYSCAIFKDYSEDLKTDVVEREPLSAAQFRKMENILRRAGIKPFDRVLEIGTGWGSLAILAAKTVNCRIDTITLSSEQRDLATERIAAEGLSDRITVHLMDYRECRLRPEWHSAFDTCMSVEMIEHVGKDFMEEFWSVLDWVLKPATGRGVVQVITLPENRAKAYENGGADFIQKWVVFPGSYLPSVPFLVDTLNRATGGMLTVDSIMNIGPHYARTLREWKRGFLAGWEGTIAPALRERHELGDKELEIFRRKWIYYFDYCEAGFATRSIGDHVITFTRPNNVEFGCDFDTVGV